jgi:hypothetical protein
MRLPRDLSGDQLAKALSKLTHLGMPRGEVARKLFG